MPPVGVLVVDKPTGLTSHKAAAEAGRIAGARKSGHAGTLDPLATGVLVVCLERATVLTRFLAGGTKEYDVTAVLGMETDTYDIDGRLLARREPGTFSKEEISSAAGSLVGEVMQVPPAYSAVKHRGKPLYSYARSGVVVKTSPRKVTVESIDVEGPRQGPDGLTVRMRVRCGPGTYIRSIVHDVGVALGCGACVSQLRRLRSGAFSIEEAVSLEELRSGKKRVSDALLSMEEATSWMPSRVVNSAGELAVSQGKPLRTGWLDTKPGGVTTGEVFRVLDGTGAMLALHGTARPEDEEDICGRPVRVIRPATLEVEYDENT